MNWPFLSSRTACVPTLPQPTSMLPLPLTASPVGAHDPVGPRMPGAEKSIVCRTLPAVLIWASPPIWVEGGIPVPCVNNAGIETQNDPCDPGGNMLVVSGFHAGCSMPPASAPPWLVGTVILLLGIAVGGAFGNVRAAKCGA